MWGSHGHLGRWSTADRVFGRAGECEFCGPAIRAAPQLTSVGQIFFFKAHILAGQVSLNSPEISDFAWLTKEEIGERVDSTYWSGIKDMLADS